MNPSPSKVLRFLQFHPLGQRPYFFDGGVRFECKRCGGCCTGEPGLVRVSPGEISAIGDFLNVGLDELEETYLRRNGLGWVIGEDLDGRCFFHENGCRIYEVRPHQCRTFPFWVRHFRSEEAFQRLASSCPGIGQGRHFTKEEILDRLDG